MIAWYLYYLEDGSIVQTCPETPLKEFKGKQMCIDQYSPLDQIELLNELRKLPRGFFVEENPITGKPKLSKQEKDTKNYIKPNLIEIVSTQDADVDVIVDDTGLQINPKFEFNGSIKIYVTELDPNFVSDTLVFDANTLHHQTNTLNKRFFVRSYEKSFSLKQNKYTV
jgi:hypothetical protein